MRLQLLTLATLLMASTTAAQAAWTSDQIAAEYSAQGFTRVEIDISTTQAKVEAIKGNVKLEVIYDLATGAVLKTENELVDENDDTTPGVFVRDRAGRVFLEGQDSDDDDDHGGRGGDDDDDDHDDDHGGHGHDDGADDDDDHGGGHDDD